MRERVALTGNDAAAEALRQVNPDVASVFPITPQTELMHKFAEFVFDGVVDTEMIHVESEHSALSAAAGSQAAGARTFTATSSAGMALLWEMLYVTASSRLPVVMALINRALSGPINIHCDHSDGMGARDSGWIQLYGENAQESYDNTIMAFRIAEHPDVQLPVMSCLDGFILSHTMEVLEILDDKEVKKFVGEYKPKHWLLEPGKPMTMGPLDLPPYYFEHKRQQVEAMETARKVILQVGEEFGKLSGRKYGNFDKYKLDDAELAVVIIGSAAGTAKVAVDQLRAKGIKAGLLKLRVFRPFPANEIREALSKAKAVAVFDRAISYGLTGGPIFHEIRSAMQGLNTPMLSAIYGLGGRDIVPEQIAGFVPEIEKAAKTGKVERVQSFIGLRE